jgi:hypothetical protein
MWPYSNSRAPLVRGGERQLAIRILVAIEDVYRVYREVIAAGIQVMRPQHEVASSGLEDLEGEIARLDPLLVVCSQDKPASISPEVAWVKAPIEAFPHTSDLLTLDKLLTIIDDLEVTKRAPG